MINLNHLTKTQFNKKKKNKFIRISTEFKEDEDSAVLEDIFKNPQEDATLHFVIDEIYINVKRKITRQLQKQKARDPP